MAINPAPPPDLDAPMTGWRLLAVWVLGALAGWVIVAVIAVALYDALGWLRGLL
jgi:hypothetical protein